MNNKLIIIVGPTGTNKSQLALEINKEFKYPIINADAFQVYKELNCGTNKLDQDIIKNAPVYLMDNISIYDEWNIATFQKQAKIIIKKIQQNNQIPILVGGSNLYVECLIKDYDLSNVSKRNHTYEDLSNEALYEKLFQLDPSEAKKITVGNKKRLLRALQIIDESKQLKSKKDIQVNNVYDCLIIYCDIPREQLYIKLNDRVEKMIDAGWLKEVWDLMDVNPDVIKLQAFKAIGYIDVANSITLNDSINIDKIAQQTRNYAKRQITWCKNKYPNALIYDQHNLQTIIKEVNDFIND